MNPIYPLHILRRFEQQWAARAKSMAQRLRAGEQRKDERDMLRDGADIRSTVESLTDGRAG
jgi:hypothetical protein